MRIPINLLIALFYRSSGRTGKDRLAILVFLVLVAVGNAAGADRVRDGLQALYDFQSASGAVIEDVSGAGEPVDLKIETPAAVRRTAGVLEVRNKALIRSAKPAGRVAEAIRQSGEITVEAWIHPARTNQSGPARIITLSKDSGTRNVTLGQDGDHYDVRMRTTGTSTNGIPSISSKPKSLAAKLTHVVYTRDKSGRALIYLDGKRNTEGKVSGATSNWDKSLGLALANEPSKDRPWLGSYHLVAVYSRALSPEEVGQNFQAGAGAKTAAPGKLTEAKPTPVPAKPTPPPVKPAPITVAKAEVKPVPGSPLFEEKIAPLLARHCLECHDATTKKGKLDLSRKSAAFAGGKSGKAIVPGKPADSLAWKSVDHDEMPEERDPLSAEEKKVLHDWIAAGAPWTIDTIDPVLYTRESRAAENWIARLTLPEYIETVRGAVGVDIAEDAARILPPDLRADGFSNTAYNLGVDLANVEAYAKLAGIIVEKMDPVAFAAKFSKKNKLDADEMKELIEGMGQWVLRAPLNRDEINAYRGIAIAVASSGGDFKEAVGFIIEAMLQSPRFLYRMETQRGDGTLRALDNTELASRLSYLLWGGPPDRDLLKAADAKELSDPAKLKAQVQRMLGDPRAIDRSLHFIRDWLHLDNLDNLSPDKAHFPSWNAALATDMREETLAFFKEIAWEQKRPLSDLLNAPITITTPRLAAHYRLPAPKEKSGGPAKYDLSKVEARGGLLTQGSVLTIGGDDASMVTRGLFVLHGLLRGAVKDPPPCVDTTPVPTKAGLTQRDIAEQRITNVSCGGCHSKFEPLAFGLEKFDGIGAFHQKDKHGNPLREDGEILIPGAEKPILYRTTEELMNLLAGNDRVRQSLTWKVTQFALGRPLTAADAPAVDQIHQVAQKEGGTWQATVTAIVMSDLVRKIRTESKPPS